MNNKKFEISNVLQQIIDGFGSIYVAFDFRFVGYNDNIDRCAFFEEINLGWYEMYISPYDDIYYPYWSQERVFWLGGIRNK